MASAEEIKRGDFVFRDTFFVDLGSGKRHTRAAESELRDLLIPKKSSSTASPPKDQVAHWYEAQLLHYGLPRTKDKNLAKVRLTQALGGGKLTVPDDIKKMEGAMKKEWQAAVRKAAKGEKGAELKSAAGAAGKKRKAADVEENGPKMKVTYNGMSVDVDFPATKTPRSKATAKKPKTEAVAKKTVSSPVATTTATIAKKTTASTPARGASTSTRGGKKAAPATTARSIAQASDGASKATTKPTPPSRPKQTARRSAPFNANNLSYRPDPAPRPYDSDSIMEDANDYDSYDDDGDAPPPYDAHDFSHSSPPEKARHSNNDVLQISGNYEISAFLEDLPVPSPTLVLAIDPANNELWGRLDLPGKLRCIISGDLPSVQRIATTPVIVSWRAEDFETGSFMFRRENRGRLALDGEGGLEGTVFGLVDGEDLVLEGELTHGYGTPRVGELRGEWQAIARRAYGRQ